MAMHSDQKIPLASCPPTAQKAGFGGDTWNSDIVTKLNPESTDTIIYKTRLSDVKMLRLNGTHFSREPIVPTVHKLCMNQTFQSIRDTFERKADSPND